MGGPGVCNDDPATAGKKVKDNAMDATTHQERIRDGTRRGTLKAA
jgi:hypothetical protein